MSTIVMVESQGYPSAREEMGAIVIWANQPNTTKYTCVYNYAQIVRIFLEVYPSGVPFHDFNHSMDK